MSAKYFIDTNIFIYCFDTSAPKKQRRANDIVRNAIKDRFGVTGTQVVQEFYNVAFRKFKIPLTQAEAKVYLDSVFKPLCEVITDLDIIRYAQTIHFSDKFSWFDSIIISSAISAGCPTLYSEDLQHNQTIGTLRIENPFL